MSCRGRLATRNERRCICPQSPCTRTMPREKWTKMGAVRNINISKNININPLPVHRGKGKSQILYLVLSPDRIGNTQLRRWRPPSSSPIIPRFPSLTTSKPTLPNFNNGQAQCGFVQLSNILERRVQSSCQTYGDAAESALLADFPWKSLNSQTIVDCGGGQGYLTISLARM